MLINSVIGVVLISNDQSGFHSTFNKSAYCFNNAIKPVATNSNSWTNSLIFVFLISLIIALTAVSNSSCEVHALILFSHSGFTSTPNVSANAFTNLIANAFSASNNNVDPNSTPFANAYC